VKQGAFVIKEGTLREEGQKRQKVRKPHRVQDPAWDWGGGGGNPNLLVKGEVCSFGGKKKIKNNIREKDN